MDTSYFTAEFLVDTEIPAPTVVFVNQPYYYPNGFEFIVSGAGDAYEVDFSDSRYIKFRITEACLKGAKIKIEVTKRDY